MVWQVDRLEVKKMVNITTKEERKILALILVAILLFCFTFFWISFFYSATQGTSHYGKGTIEVIFKNNVTKEEARKVIHSFNCSVDRWYGPGEYRDYWWATVNVPEGEEKNM